MTSQGLCVYTTCSYDLSWYTGATVNCTQNNTNDAQRDVPPSNHAHAQHRTVQCLRPTLDRNFQWPRTQHKHTGKSELGSHARIAVQTQ